MSKKEKKEKKKSGFGAFFGGGFLGFNLCLLLIAGLVAFVYFKVSPSWINKTFNTQIDLGSEEANNKTLNELVVNVIDLAQNMDNYKLSSLKDDFGIEIKDELFGIDITDLKDVPVSELGEAIENKFANISADELREVMDLEDSMGNILDKSNTYYYNSSDNKLYKNSDYTTEVAFDYSISNDKTKVTVKGEEFSIVSSKVEILLWNLPITSAFGDFMATMGDNLTLADLESDFGVELPSFMDNIDKANTTVNELEEAINGLYVADFLGYTIDKSDPDNKVVKDGETVVKGVLATLAQYTISNLETGINCLTLADLFAEDERTGILSLIDNPEKVTLTGETDEDKGILSISDALAKVIEEKTLGQLADAKVIDNTEFTAVRTKWINKDVTQTTNNYVQVQDLTLDELLTISFLALDQGGLLKDAKSTT